MVSHEHVGVPGCALGVTAPPALHDVSQRDRFRALVIPSIVGEHAQELSSLWTTRRILAKSNQIRLGGLAELDERIAAHIDGCVTAGSAGIEILREQLEPDAGRTFALAVVALELQGRAAWEHALAWGTNNPQCIAGLASALGWTSPRRLVGIVQQLLDSEAAVLRCIGLAACRFHGVDPGPVLSRSLNHPQLEVRIEALRAAAAIGRLNTLRDAQRAAGDDIGDVAAAAASTAVLLGDRANALERLRSFAQGQHGRRDFLELALRASDPASTRQLLSELSRDASAVRLLLVGAGVAGETRYVPWLITQMSDLKLARLAGEAFSMMTGLDLALSRLDRAQPEGVESGPTEDVDDANVDIDEDEGLPWPDAEKVAAWWNAEGTRFQDGTRFFMGQAPSRDHCMAVLKTGCQRQRVAAAHYLCLLDPGTPLFNTSAPAWRQQRLLAEMK
jgi:uncharacterized protein (TIGR02270 family)